jgi:hypothetical protein
VRDSTIGWYLEILLRAGKVEVFPGLNPYQSGFQPTVEPTAFQEVVVQLLGAVLSTAPRN